MTSKSVLGRPKYVMPSIHAMNGTRSSFNIRAIPRTGSKELEAPYQGDNKPMGNGKPLLELRQLNHAQSDQQFNDRKPSLTKREVDMIMH